MPPKTEAAKQATFTTDDKRAQYARLVVFNHGVKHKQIAKGSDVASVKNADLQKAFKDLVGGNYLDGKDGIEYIQSMTKAGATDAKVAERGLTTAYAQEVRPFIRKGLLAPSFGRRGKKAAPKEEKADTKADKTSDADAGAEGKEEKAA
jgi:hypothetical protein